MSPEQAVVALVTGGSWPASAEAWTALLHHAGDLGLAPVLAAHLPADAPSEVVSDLRLTSMAATARHARAAHQLAEMLRGAAALDVPVVALKGACLASEAYAHPSHRTFGDLDLLVRSDHLPQAVSLSESLGYAEGPPELDGWHHLPVRQRAHSLIVEWHWRPIACMFAPGLDEAELAAMWQRTRPFVVGGEPALMLAPEDQLLTLSAHWAVSHRCAGGPRPLLDVAVACRAWADEIDWSELWARAERWKLTHALAMTLTMARELAGAPAPEAMPVVPSADHAERVRRRVLGETDPRRSMLLAEAVHAGPLAVLRAVVRRLADPRQTPGHGMGRWLRHWRELWQRQGALAAQVLRRSNRADLAAEGAVADWLDESGG